MDKEYLQLVDESTKKFLQLNKAQYKKIRDIYIDAAAEMERKAVSSKSGSLTERWVLDYKRNLDKTVNRLNRELYKTIQTDMEVSAVLGTYPQKTLFDLIGKKYDIEVTERFSSILSKAPDGALKELISGSFYKDNKGLSKRIWTSGGKLGNDIDYIIQRAIVEKKSTYELAKDLEIYVSPNKKTDFQWKKVYPNVGNKVVDYNAQRLARTSISHAYTLSLIRASQKNPYVDGIQWHSALIHARTCELCRERHMQIFSVDECPVDHPQGLCTQTPIISKSLDEIGKELGDWARGGKNHTLDLWARMYGDEFVA